MHSKIKPQFPRSPNDVVRLEHLPTVEGCIRYWEAVRVEALQTGDAALAWTAESLRQSFEEARQRLQESKPSKSASTPCARLA
jgi:hypothetical protein